MTVVLGQNTTLLALGSNLSTQHGDSSAILSCALGLLESRGLHLIAVSPFYRSAPLAAVRQPDYVNLVVAIQTSQPVRAILRDIKQIERAMGRRLGVRWGPRVLDIDIISHRSQTAAGQCLGWIDRRGRPTSRRRGQIVSPHPEAHRRLFVLQPICDIMPHWFHPILKANARQLLHRLPGRRQRDLVRMPIEHTDVTCHNGR
jgi:2-amino-4-hydroxy-6-hydroxymethyldihydropteridine diphosphokinase